MCDGKMGDGEMGDGRWEMNVYVQSCMLAISPKNPPHLSPSFDPSPALVRPLLLHAASDETA